MDEKSKDVQIIQNKLQDASNEVSTMFGKYICKLLLDLSANMNNIVDVHELSQKMNGKGGD